MARDEWVTNSRARARVVDVVRARREPTCFLCGEPIDYSLAYPNALSFSVEHVKPRATHPHLTFDPANCRAAHLACNQAGGRAKVKITERVTTRRW